MRLDATSQALRTERFMSKEQPTHSGAAAFDAAMHGLVQVSKAELDAAERKYKAKRARLKQKKQGKPKS